MSYTLIKVDCKKHNVEFISTPKIIRKDLDMNESFLKIDGREITQIQYISLEKELDCTTLIACINPHYLNKSDWGRELLKESR
ncbi:hypothetical protein BB06_04105 [Pediococcus pentosaceus CGMCC 7049]|uniref:Uncharacterized protein n=1 Tax=Pediococcus pentosaceus CGMCC 7049 TaxID=1460385 RepID=A0AAU7NN79_PEDPE|nr:hypothetical protein [Pediococcus pentosaceus]MCS8573384.1 hypothetical protein [Pediococcus pentosaceus]